MNSATETRKIVAVGGRSRSGMRADLRSPTAATTKLFSQFLPKTRFPTCRLALTALLAILFSPSFLLVSANAQVASQVAEWQVALDQRNFSPGCIDGKLGMQTRQAIMAWQEANGIKVDGVMGPETERTLIGTNSNWFTTYALTGADVTGFAPISESWKVRSEMESLSHATLLERVAERFHATEQFIQTLNSEVDFTNAVAGTVLNVPCVLVPREHEKSAIVRVNVRKKIVVAYGFGDRIIGFFPCSIGKDREKRPVGELTVVVVAPNPNYTWDPEVFPESPESQTIRSKLIINPGPNNPVGTFWIGLSRPGYGIHGTPRPEEIGKTESHGCFRLANWNVETLAKMIEIGTPVVVEE